MTGRDPRSTRRTIRHLMQVRPAAYFGGGTMWIGFFLLPLGIGLLIEALFDALAGDGPALQLLAVIAGIEIGRALLVPLLGYVFEPFWVTSETVLRTNVLAAQLDPDPDRRGLPPPDAAAALPWFREDPEELTRATDEVLNLGAGLLLAAIALTILARLGWPVVVAVAAPLALATLAARWLAPLVSRRRAADRAVTAEVTGYLGEVFGAVTAIATAGAAPAVLDRLRVLCDRRRETAVRDRFTQHLVPTVAAAAGDVALAGGLVVAVLVSVDGLAPGEVALLAVYAPLLSRLPRFLASWMATRRHADVALDRLRDALPDRRLGPLLAPTDRVRLDPQPLQRRTPPRWRGPAPAVTLDGFVVEAPDGRAIGPVAVEIPAGGVAVITGAVGVGKTTLVRGLLGLAPCLAGHVRVDGVAIDPTRWMVPPNATYVAQVPTLFSERLDDNLRLGFDVPDHGLAAALTRVAAQDLLDGLEQGLATPLGPRGVRLSGGQAHRVAVARSLVVGAGLVVADDLSAALDAPTESALLDGVLAGQRRTLVLVSHRPAVLQRADVVIELTAELGA